MKPVSLTWTYSSLPITAHILLNSNSHVMLLINPIWHFFIFFLAYWSFYLLFLVLNCFLFFLFCISQIWLAISVFTCHIFTFIILVSSSLAPEGTFLGGEPLFIHSNIPIILLLVALTLLLQLLKKNVTAKNVTTPSFIANYDLWVSC